MFMSILFFVLWIIFNGNITLEIAIFGIVISAVMYVFMCKFMNYSFATDKKICKMIPLVIQYIGLLVWEIIKANLVVMKYIVNDSIETEPVIIKSTSGLNSTLARVVLANSITMTPGTITVELEGDNFTIHCLDKDIAEDASELCFTKVLKKMEALG